ncbi:hypothetical protein RYX36_004358 [Vicia faba]
MNFLTVFESYSSPCLKYQLKILIKSKRETRFIKEFQKYFVQEATTMVTEARNREGIRYQKRNINLLGGSMWWLRFPAQWLRFLARQKVLRSDMIWKIWRSKRVKAWSLARWIKLKHGQEPSANRK